GYWGHWREARSLVRRFTSAKNWRLPYHASAVVCSTPVASVLGASWRVISKPFGYGTPSGLGSERVMTWNQNGHPIRTPDSKIRILAVVEATNVNAVAKNMFEFHRAANELAQQSAEFPVIELSLVTFDRDNNS